MGSKIKVLIDPLYVNPCPFHLIPKILGSRGVPLGPLSSRCGAPVGGSWIHRAFGPGRFDGMDLGFGFTDILDADLNIRETVLEQYGSKGWPIYSFHTTFGGGSPLFADTRMELTEDSERTRRGLRNQVLVAARLRSLTPAVVVLHLGRTSGDPARALERSLRVIDSVVHLAEEGGLVLALENMPRCPPGETYLGSDYRDLQKALRTLRSPAVKVCLDWGHANNYSRFFARDNRREPIEQYVRSFGYVREMIDELGEDIGYAHIHYNRSHTLAAEAFFEEYDEHMALSRIPLEERETFAEVIAHLVRTTSVQEIGLLNLELIPRTFFWVYRAFPTGSTLKEQLASARLLRQMVAAGVQAGGST